MYLATEEPDTFKTYVHWLYCNTIPVPIWEVDDNFDLGCIVLIRAYLLGNRLLDANFQNAGIGAIWER